MWCEQKHINPLSAPVESVLSYLAFQFHKGYKCRSLNVCCSTISSIHLRIDGFEVGQHPLVVRLIYERCI